MWDRCTAAGGVLHASHDATSSLFARVITAPGGRGRADSVKEGQIRCIYSVTSQYSYCSTNFSVPG